MPDSAFANGGTEAEEEFRRLILRFRAEPAEALAALMGVLASAGDAYVREPDRRTGPLIAVAGMAHFARARSDMQAAAVFDRIACSLQDLDRGLVDPIFKHTEFGSRPPISIKREMMIGLALECVCRICLIDKLKIGEARAIVAKWLRHIPDFDGTDCSAKTLKGWDDKFKRDPRLMKLRAHPKERLALVQTSDGLRHLLEQLGKVPLK